jgi:hypothetical protein
VVRKVELREAREIGVGDMGEGMRAIIWVLMMSMDLLLYGTRYAGEKACHVFREPDG